MLFAFSDVDDELQVLVVVQYPRFEQSPPARPVGVVVLLLVGGAAASLLDLLEVPLRVRVEFLGSELSSRRAQRLLIVEARHLEKGVVCILDRDITVPDNDTD